ncbi:hypothetical protein ACFQ9X_45445 [Catenulispora yoronensis]
MVFVDPPNDDVCGPGLRAVVFHGPKGSGADQLSAQIGPGFYSPQSGFLWAQRTPDGAFTLLLVEAPTVRTLKAGGTLGTKSATARPPVATPDGSLLTTYAPGTNVPATFDFTDPGTGRQGSNPVTFTLTAPTAQALATTLNLDPATISPTPETDHLGIAFRITNGPRFSLTATDPAPGAENVYWTEIH